MLTYWYWPRLVDGMVQHGRVWRRAGWALVARFPMPALDGDGSCVPGVSSLIFSPQPWARRAHLPPCTPLPATNTANNRGEAWLLLPQLWAGGGDYCSIWKQIETINCSMLLYGGIISLQASCVLCMCEPVDDPLKLASKF